MISAVGAEPVRVQADRQMLALHGFRPQPSGSRAAGTRGVKAASALAALARRTLGRVNDAAAVAARGVRRAVNDGPLSAHSVLPP